MKDQNLPILMVLALLFLLPSKSVETSEVIAKPVEVVVHNAEPVVDKPVKDEPTTVSTIVVHTMPGCLPCAKWWNIERPKWEKQGWRVVKVVDVNPVKPVPFFDIDDGIGNKWNVDSYLTPERFFIARKDAGIK